MPMLFKSWRIVSIQFFLGLPGFRLALWSACQYTACFGILLSSMRSTCHSHLSLLSLMMRFNSSNFVCCLTALFRTLSFQDIPNSRRWNLWWVASNFFLLCDRERPKLCTIQQWWHDQRFVQSYFDLQTDMFALLYIFYSLKHTVSFTYPLLAVFVTITIARHASINFFLSNIMARFQCCTHSTMSVSGI